MKRLIERRAYRTYYYKCPYCGFEHAVWHIKLYMDRRDFCERCYVKAMNRYCCVTEWHLHGKGV